MPDGFVLDCYSDPLRGEMVVWLKTEEGAVRLAERFTPVVHARSRSPAALADLAEALALVRGVGRCERVEALCGLEDEPSPVLRIPVTDHRMVLRVAQMVDARGDYRDFEVFDADLRMSHRYFLAKGLWPLAQVRAWTAGRYRLLEASKWATDYEAPPLSLLEVGAQTATPRGELPTAGSRFARAWVGEPGGERVVVESADEERVLRGLFEEVQRRDPDVVLTQGGDTFLLPHLQARAAALGVPFYLGREPDPAKPRKAAKSYFSYGKIKYQAAAYALHGRIHVDKATSFFWSQAGMHGLVDLARLSNVPLQDIARLGAGTALTAIQIDLAASQGRLVPWKKNVPEAFKTARELLLADRGGYIFEPRVGLHENVDELDFASMYPNLMVNHNISPETINCACCSPEALPFWNVTPQVGTWTCARRRGFIPTYLEPVVARREHFKRMRKVDPAGRARYQEICDVYKWLLVTSFGYQGYKNAKFGRIECHEAISAWGRETLLSANEIARDHGFEFVHGIVDSLWIRRLVPGADPLALGDAVSRELGIRFEHQGRYKWIVFLPTRSHPAVGDVTAVGALNRYYGCFETPPDKPSRSQPSQPVDYLAGGAMKVRGVEMRQHSSPRVLQEAQERFLQVVARADDAAGFLALLPEAVEATRPVLARVLGGACRLEELVFTNTVSKDADGYSVVTCAGAAAKQLAKRGMRVAPGDSVRYVVTDAASRDPERKVVETRILRGDEAYDRDEYARAVLRAVASLTLPFGLDEEALARRFLHGGQTRIERFLRAV